MPKINPKLLDAIGAKLGIAKAQVYKRISQAASEHSLTRDIAAIRVAADARVTINKYATEAQIAQLRGANTQSNQVPVVVSNSSGPSARPIPKSKSAKKKVPNQVFVVHGRDMVARDAVFNFLRAVDVTPMEWNKVLKLTKKASPYIGEILDAAFSNARAVVVILTPDDMAMLREDLWSQNEKPFEKTLMGQARPNVLFEAGMAFATHSERTIILQLGSVREFSDTLGRHVLHMSGDSTKRQEFATKLGNAGCEVDTNGSDWLTAGDFTDPMNRVPKKRKKRK